MQLHISTLLLPSTYLDDDLHCVEESLIGSLVPSTLGRGTLDMHVLQAPIS